MSTTSSSMKHLREAANNARGAVKLVHDLGMGGPGASEEELRKVLGVYELALGRVADKVIYWSRILECRLASLERHRQMHPKPKEKGGSLDVTG